MRRRTRRETGGSRWPARVARIVLTPLGLLVVWGVGIEPRLISEKHEPVSIPGLGARWEGREIAVFGDLQLGMWLGNEGTARRMVRRLLERPPAAVLVAGDLVYKPEGRVAETAARATRLLRPLVEAGIPTFAVLGNHDYAMHWADDPPRPEIAREVAGALERIGVRVLSNEAVGLALVVDGRESEPLWIVGVGDPWAGESRPVTAVHQVPDGAPRVVLMHNPASFPELPSGSAPLAVAAHTHGGQISIPFIPHWSWMEWTKHDPIEPSGWASEDEEPWGNRLYVNPGIGFSDIPVRINARPELTRFVLRRGPVTDDES